MRKQYSKSEVKEFLATHPFATQTITKKSIVVLDDNQLFVDGRLSFLNFDGDWIPSLRLLLLQPHLLAQVVVDKGAIRFVVNGADVMRPGIVQTDDFSKGALVVIVDEGFYKPLAVGKALFSSEEMNKKSTGKVVSLLHFIGDMYWEKG